jgi:hypothetical protein
MKRDRYWATPKKLWTDAPGGAWWYASKGSIEVHADADHNKLHVKVRIPRSVLVEYLRRTERSSKT